MKRIDDLGKIFAYTMEPKDREIIFKKLENLPAGISNAIFKEKNIDKNSQDILFLKYLEFLSDTAIKNRNIFNGEEKSDEVADENTSTADQSDYIDELIQHAIIDIHELLKKIKENNPQSEEAIEKVKNCLQSLDVCIMNRQYLREDKDIPDNFKKQCTLEINEQLQKLCTDLTNTIQCEDLKKTSQFFDSLTLKVFSVVGLTLMSCGLAMLICNPFTAPIAAIAFSCLGGAVIGTGGMSCVLPMSGYFEEEKKKAVHEARLEILTKSTKNLHERFFKTPDAEQKVIVANTQTKSPRRGQNP